MHMELITTFKEETVLKKRIISVVLVLCMLMSVVGCSAEEEERKPREERNKSEKEDTDEYGEEPTQEVDKIETNNNASVKVSSDKFLVYTKDRELYCYNIETKETVQMTSDYGVNSTNSELAKRPMPMLLANDGKTLLFSSAEGKGGSLYVCNLENPKDTMKLVGENISDNYFINYSGTLVTYRTKSPRELHQYDVVNDTNVMLGTLRSDNDIQISIDGDTIAYIVDKVFYIKKIGEERQVIFNDVKDIYPMESNLDKIIFIVDSNTSENNWLCYEKGKGVRELGNTKLDGNMLINFDENGGIYNSKSKDPISGTKKELQKYLDNGYFLDNSEESYVINADNVNEDDLTYRILIDDIYYYSGGVNELVGTDCYMRNMSNYHVKPVVAFRETSSGNFYVALGAKKELVTDDAVIASAFNLDGNVLYYLTKDEGEEDTGTIYKVEINGDSIGKPIKMYDQVLVSAFIEKSVFRKNLLLGTISKDCLYYFKKGSKEGEVQLYLGNTFVHTITDISKFRIEEDTYYYYEDAPVLYFYTDYDGNTSTGSLFAFNGETIKIADNAYNAKLTPNGNLLYMKNYDKESCLGELYYYNNGKSEKIDDNIIPPTEMMYSHDLLKIYTQLIKFL